MLKTYQYFFVVLFLGSMLFTVFQYMPILEEEIHVSKTLSKKANDPLTEDGADDDANDDGDDDDKDEFFDRSNNNDLALLSSNSKFNALHENYLQLVFNISTPPPELV
jgi:hypothetical protein